jgi:hypothetical protein
MTKHNLENNININFSDHEIWCYFNMESRKHGDRLKPKTIEVIDGLLKLGNEDVLTIRPERAIIMYKLSRGEWGVDCDDADMIMMWLGDNPSMVRMVL